MKNRRMLNSHRTEGWEGGEGYPEEGGRGDRDNSPKEKDLNERAGLVLIGSQPVQSCGKKKHRIREISS